MVPSEDKKHPERPLSEMTDEELLRDIAEALEKPAKPGKESLAEHLERMKDTKTVEVSVVTSYRDGAIATRDNIGRIVFQVDANPVLVTRKGYDNNVLPTLLKRIQNDIKLGAVCGQIPSEKAEHFWELVDGDEDLDSKSSKTL